MRKHLILLEALRHRVDLATIGLEIIGDAVADQNLVRELACGAVALAVFLGDVLLEQSERFVAILRPCDLLVRSVDDDPHSFVCDLTCSVLALLAEPHVRPFIMTTHAQPPFFFIIFASEIDAALFAMSRSSNCSSTTTLGFDRMFLIGLAARRGA